MSTGPPDLTSVLNLPPALLANFPGAQPPPGVTPNFKNPESQGPVILGINSASIALCSIFFLIRCYNKAFVARRVWWDDLTCLLAYLCTIIVFAGPTAAVIYGPLGKHQWDVYVPALISDVYLIGSAFLLVVMVNPTLMLVKATFFLMYLDIFAPFKWMRVTCIIGLTLSTAFYFAVSVTQFVFATPARGESFAEHALSGRIYKTWTLNVPPAAVGLVIDVVLFVLPIIAVTKLNMPLKKKVGTSFVFASGALAIVGSILSLYYRVANGWNPYDTTWSSAPVQVAAIVESSFGLICVCMPSLWKIARQHKGFTSSFFSVFSRLTSRRDTSGSRSSGGKSYKMQHDEDDTQALSYRPQQRRHNVTTASVSDGDLEEQKEGSFHMAPYSADYAQLNEKTSSPPPAAAASLTAWSHKPRAQEFNRQGITRTVEVRHTNEPKLSSPAEARHVF